MILDYLRQNVEKYPEGIFLVSGNESYTYSQFYDMMNQFSARLNQLKIGKGDRVGVMLPNIPEWIIKHGFNVYPKEIENELLTHPDIKECSVIGIRDEAVGEKIKMCVVSANGNSMNKDEITNYCSERMAAYKVPDIVEIMAGLPKNASGKVLKKSLRMLHKY